MKIRYKKDNIELQIETSLDEIEYLVNLTSTSRQWNNVLLEIMKPIIP